MFSVSFCIRISMMAVRVLLESVNVLFEAIIWEMTYLSKKSASARLSSSEENIVVLMMHGWHAGSLLGFH